MIRHCSTMESEVALLQDAMPAYQKAVAALGRLEMADMVRIRTYRVPPEKLRHLARAVLIVFQMESKSRKKKQLDEDWHTFNATLLMNPVRFKRRVLEYDQDAVPMSVVRKLTMVIDSPELEEAGMSRVSQAALGLLQWVRGLYEYDRCKWKAEQLIKKRGRACGGVASIQETLKNLFRKGDVSGDGLMDLGEFTKFMRQMGGPACVMSDKEIDRLFEAADRDGSGEVSLDEFLDFLYNGDVIRFDFVPGPHAQDVHLEAECELKRYTDVEGIRRVLELGDIALVRGSWLADRARKGRTIVRRQDLPEGALWDPQDLFEDDRLQVKIVAISYCWLTPVHPDPRGEQLQETLGPALTLLMEREGCDVAVFLDFCSCYQKPFADDEKMRFKRALAHINLWYTHMSTTVWMLTGVPHSWRRRSLPYHERGWPSFEFAISCMISPFDAVLDLGLLKQDHTDYSSVWLTCRGPRRAPMLPDRFSEELQQKVFTNGADCEMVIAKYKETFFAVMGGAQRLVFADFGWRADDLAVLAESLPHCYCLRHLDLDFNKFGDRGAKALLAALLSCRRLEVLSLQATKISDASVESLSACILQCTSLRELDLRKNPITARCRSQLLEAWQQGVGRLDVDLKLG